MINTLLQVIFAGIPDLAKVAIASELMKYTANKGSITVDGISLTTNTIRS